MLSFFAGGFLAQYGEPLQKRRQFLFLSRPAQADDQMIECGLVAGIAAQGFAGLIDGALIVIGFEIEFA